MLSASALLWTRIAAAIVVFLAVNAAYAIYLQRKKAAKYWPSVPGEVTESRSQESQVATEDDNAATTVTIRYRYRVGGKNYEGSRVRFGSASRVRSLEADELTGKYPVGTRAPVYYNPKRPSQSVLEPGNSNLIAVLTVFLVVWVAIAAVLIAHGVTGRVLTTTTGVPLFAFLLPLAAIAVGAISLGNYWRLRRERLASARWPTTSGRIMRSEVVVQTERTKDSEGYEKFKQVFRPSLGFAYRVGDREYHSTRWNWGWTGIYSTPSDAEAIVAKYKVGSEVTVYFDPANPEVAVLDPANKAGAAAPLVFGLMFMIVGLVFLFVFTHLQMQ